MQRSVKSWLANLVLLIGSVFMALISIEGLIALALSYPGFLGAETGGRRARWTRLPPSRLSGALRRNLECRMLFAMPGFRH